MQLGIGRQYLHLLLDEDPDNGKFPSRKLEARIFEEHKIQPTAWDVLARRYFARKRKLAS